MKSKLPFPENLHADLVKRTYMDPSEADASGVLAALEQFRDNLDPKDILLLHYKEQKTLTEISKIYGVTPEYIRICRNSGLWLLRKLIRSGLDTSVMPKRNPCQNYLKKYNT